MANDLSELAKRALSLLSVSKNVLVSGPPGTGKSRLLNEVAEAFSRGAIVHLANDAPVLNLGAAMPIQAPPAAKQSPDLAAFIPSPDKSNREVFPTVFHQNYKHREFVTGIVPSIKKNVDGADFTVLKGKLYLAAEHARKKDATALLVIDEINRGPAVQIFGGGIVAIEADKRLAPDGTLRVDTQRFDLIDPATGELAPYALPHDLYILAAMNQADASVEPLDVAFLRRWEPLTLDPDEKMLRDWLGISAKQEELPDAPTGPKHIFEASVRAWVKVNRRISLGRGPEYQIGHGILMNLRSPGAATMAEAQETMSRAWARIRAHVDEVFFGDQRGIAATFNAIDDVAGNPLRLVESTFAGDLRNELQGPKAIPAEQVYPALKAFGADEL